MIEQQYVTRTGWRSGTAGFALWTGASTISGLGSSMQVFAVNWEATGFGAHIAGLVATAGPLPGALSILIVSGSTPAGHVVAASTLPVIIGLSVGIVQAVPMVIMNLVYGFVAGLLGAGSALLVTAGICAAAALVVIGNHRLPPA